MTEDIYEEYFNAHGLDEKDAEILHDQIKRHFIGGLFSWLSSSDCENMLKPIVVKHLRKINEWIDYGNVSIMKDGELFFQLYDDATGEPTNHKFSFKEFIEEEINAVREGISDNEERLLFLEDQVKRLRSAFDEEKAKYTSTTSN